MDPAPVLLSCMHCSSTHFRENASRRSILNDFLPHLGKSTLSRPPLVEGALKPRRGARFRKIRESASHHKRTMLCSSKNIIERIREESEARQAV